MRHGFSRRPSVGKCLELMACCFRGRPDCRPAGDMRLAMNSRGDSLEICTRAVCEGPRDGMAAVSVLIRMRSVAQRIVPCT